MRILISLSLLLNLAVLVPVGAGLLANGPWAEAAYGPATPARGILLAVYAAIAAGSVLLLVAGDPRSVALLLCLQVVYKLATPWTVGDAGHPVVVANLLIAGFHAVTLVVIWRCGGLGPAGGG